MSMSMSMSMKIMPIRRLRRCASGIISASLSWPNWPNWQKLDNTLAQGSIAQVYTQLGDPGKSASSTRLAIVPTLSAGAVDISV
ncbi:MAG: hypothetical protein KBA32_00970 [Propionivibrio sp.]|uniref:hypothetical protein n=1 Tax=Propionivibrio sp. TaxID=2212460 RepID=UPI001B75B257|nr:hypothetical protein [Propionivibrio sp.]MBP7201757.1 hypothetical protein [Propionivibrio sp.]